MKKLFILPLLFVVYLSTTASLCTPNVTPVANVAILGAKVELSVDQILVAAQTAHTQTNPVNGQPLVTTAQLDQVAIVVDKVGREGQTLSQALIDYSAAKKAGVSTVPFSTSIQSLIGDMTTALGTVGKTVPSGTVQQIDQAIAGVLAVFVQIKAGLGL